MLHFQEDAGVLLTTALDVDQGFGMLLVINATTMQVRISTFFTRCGALNVRECIMFNRDGFNCTQFYLMLNFFARLRIEA
jgi:hypothetical protein